MRRKRKEVWPTVEKKYTWTEDNPRYGQAFQLVAIQLENIDREYKEWLFVEDLTDNELIKVGKDWSEYRKIKNNLSDRWVKFLNPRLINGTPFKDVVALLVHYFGDDPDTYHVL